MMRLVSLVAFLLGSTALSAAEPASLKILFLGDNGHHRPVERYRQLLPVMAKRGIDLTYTDKADALNPKTLASYDGLVIYANNERITPDQEKALLDYVASGKGLIPLHCASYCFHNSPAYIALVGAQFQSHRTGVFRTNLAQADHPILKGFGGFESWDETYVHTKHNETDRTVLEYRAETGRSEPWTWVRTHGKGRVFYTAWGHDERTWAHPGFHNLVERGIRWAVGGDPAAAGPYRDRPEMTSIRKDVKPFEYVDANIPFYPAGRQWGVTEKGARKMQLPLDPAESMKHMTYPADFDLKLFASEAILGGKPLCMNWDERGRLWVAITLDYPNEMQPEGKGRDRILVVEDTDGDGSADKTTIFADKLSIPTSLTFANGGIVVHQAPQTLFLKDTDGDGKADERRVLINGWGTRDTHAGPSNLQYGLDGWLYGIVGYSGFDGTVGGVRHRFGQGFYRFKADGSQLEFLRSTNNNSWGVGFSEEGYLFGSTANGVPSVYLSIPNRYYEAVRGWSPGGPLPSIAFENRFQPVTDKVRQVDWHGGFTAAAGHALYTARLYPREYWNRTAFVTDGTGHLAATFVLQPNGSDFQSRYAWNLLASDDEWSAPSMVEVGPDGCLWVIDWYNFIYQHNPTPPGFKTGRGAAYETELRDKKHGRIYRLVPKSAKLETYTLKDATPEKLAAALQKDNFFWRRHAQRLLLERGQKDVTESLIKLVKDSSMDEIGLNVGAIHALWTLHGLGTLDTATTAAGLRHRSAGVRRTAATVVARNPEGLETLLATGVLSDSDAQVRLATLLALSEMPTQATAAEQILTALRSASNLGDRWIADSLTAAAAAHDAAFLAALAKDKTPLSVRGNTLAGIVAEHFGRKGEANGLNSLIVALADGESVNAEIILTGLARGWPRSKTATLDADAEKALVRLMARVAPGTKGQVLRLASAWGSRGFEKQAAETANLMSAALADTKLSDRQRGDAARELIGFLPTDSTVAEKVLEAITPRNSPTLTVSLLDALAASEAPNVGEGIVSRMASWSPSARGAGLRLLLLRPTSTRALLDGLDKGRVQLDELALDQKQALAVHPDRSIRTRARSLLERRGGLPSADRQKVIEETVGVTRKIGDAVAGKAIFTKHCANCHTHTGEGSHVGPDLTGMAVHPKEHLLTEILDPSRNVEANFRVYSVETKDGRTMSGLLASETQTSIEIVDSQAKRFTVLRENIDALVASPKSVMPEGFEKQLKEGELVDLLEFLTKRGRYLPLPLGKVATVVSTKGMFYGEEAQAERLIFRDWTPKTFAGVPFVLVDPQGGRAANVILLHGPNGAIPPKMPKAVTVPCNSPAKAIHLLSGVSGWGYPATAKGTTSMIVRLRYADGMSEDHELKNGEHFADYIRRVDVPGSQFAFALRQQQLRYLSIQPKRTETIKEIELVKGPDDTAPVVVALTLEGNG